MNQERSRQEMVLLVQLTPFSPGIHFFSCWLQALSKPFHCAFKYLYHCTTDVSLALHVMRCETLNYVTFFFDPKSVGYSQDYRYDHKSKAVIRTPQEFNGILKGNYSQIYSWPNDGAVISLLISAFTQSDIFCQSIFSSCKLGCFQPG